MTLKLPALHDLWLLPSNWSVHSVLLLGTATALAIGVLFLLHRRGLNRRQTLDLDAEWSAWLPPAEFITVDGMRIRCLRAGQGRPIVLIHGIGASSYAWRFVFAPLARRYSVIALDLPGFGTSDAPVDGTYDLDAQADRLDGILTKLGLGPCGLVGSSMGGAIALWMGKRKPARYAKVAVLAPAVDPALVPIGAQRLGRASHRLRRALGPRLMRAILSRVVNRARLVSPEAVEAYLKPYLERSEPHIAFWSSLGLLADRRLPRDLANPQSEVLVLYGYGDRVVSKRGLDRYLRLAPSATFRSHPEAGHHLMEDEPAWTVRALNEFFG